MKSKPVFAGLCVAAITIAAWFGANALPVHGDPNEQPSSDQLKAANEKLDKILALLHDAQQQQAHSMVEVTLSEKVATIFKTRIQTRDGKVVAGEVHRADFTKSQQSDLDEFLREKSGRKDVTFSWAVNSSCDNCINTGAPNYYNIWIPLPGGGGFYACGGC